MFKSIFVQQRKTSLSITDGEDEKDYTPIGATRSCKGKGYSVNYDVGYSLLCVRFSEVRELVNILRPNLFTIRRLFLSLQRKVKLPSTCVMVILELNNPRACRGLK